MQKTGDTPAQNAPDSPEFYNLIENEIYNSFFDFTRRPFLSRLRRKHDSFRTGFRLISRLDIG